MRLTEHVYVVGGGDAGFGLSGRLDANCYAIDTGAGIWLFDVGFDAGDRVVDNLRAEGLDPADVTHVLLTHNHADHAGAAAAVRRRLEAASGSSPQFAAAAELAGDLRQGDTVANGYEWAQRVGFYPEGVGLEPCPVDVELVDGMRISAGSVEVVAIATPGHSRGHFSFLVTGAGPTCLIGGDHVFWNGRILLQNLPDVDIGAYARSMAKVADLEFSALLPGHSGVSLEHGKRHVLAALQSFENIGVPPGLF